jgi:A/G-specific adenine glycosylase
VKKARAKATSTPAPPSNHAVVAVEPADHTALARAIVAWFEKERRTLPWRAAAPKGSVHIRDPYATLVSELMLQQTQVSRVIEKFTAFMAEFPTAASLAEAPESRVLAQWSGLGYYRRARLLHAAAKAIVDRHAGQVPVEHAALLDLPGVGRYTAGAIASIAMGQSVPLVDGNVGRVLFRIHGREAVHGDPGDMEWAWECAREMVTSAAKGGLAAGELNEGLMELGATICTPAAPRCMFCPVQSRCRAFAQGLQEEIPRPKKAVHRSTMWCESVLILDDRGRVLGEERTGKGMWAGLWQAPTHDHAGEKPWNAAQVRAWLGLAKADRVEHVERIKHGTTHRDVTFTVWRVEVDESTRSELAKGRRWLTSADLDQLGLSNPQRKILGEIAAKVRGESGERRIGGPQKRAMRGGS